MKFKVDIQNLLPEQKNTIALPKGSEVDQALAKAEIDAQDRLRRDLNYRTIGSKVPLPDPEASYTREEKALAAWARATEREREATLKKEAQRQRAISSTLKNLKSAKVGGKQISEINIALALSILTTPDIKRLNAAATTGSPYESYAAEVKSIVEEKFKGELGILGSDTGVMALEALLGLLASGGLTLSLLAAGDATALGSTVWAYSTSLAIRLGSLLSGPVAIGVGLLSAVWAYYADKRLNEIDQSEIESVLMDMKPLFEEMPPTSPIVLLRTLESADPEFMKAPGSESKDFDDFYDGIQNAAKSFYGLTTGKSAFRGIDVLQDLESAFSIYEKYRDQKKGLSKIFKAYDRLSRIPERAGAGPTFAKDLLYTLEYFRKVIRAPRGKIEDLPNKGKGRAWLGKKIRTGLVGEKHVTYKTDQMAKMMFSGFNAVRGVLDRKPGGGLPKKDIASPLRSYLKDIQKESKMKIRFNLSNLDFKEKILREGRIGVVNKPWDEFVRIPKQFWDEWVENIPRSSRHSKPLKAGGKPVRSIELAIQLRRDKIQTFFNDLYNADPGSTQKLLDELENLIDSARDDVLQVVSTEVTKGGRTETVFFVVSKRGLEGVATAEDSAIAMAKRNLESDIAPVVDPKGKKPRGRVKDRRRGGIDNPYSNFEEAKAAIEGLFGIPGMVQRTIRNSKQLGDPDVFWPVRTGPEGKSIYDINPETDFVYYGPPPGNPAGALVVRDGQIHALGKAGDDYAKAFDKSPVSTLKGLEDEAVYAALPQAVERAIPKAGWRRQALMSGYEFGIRSPIQFAKDLYGASYKVGLLAKVPVLGTLLGAVAVIGQVFGKAPFAIAYEVYVYSLIRALTSLRYSTVANLAKVYFLIQGINNAIAIFSTLMNNFITTLNGVRREGVQLDFAAEELMQRREQLASETDPTKKAKLEEQVKYLEGRVATLEVSYVESVSATAQKLGEPSNFETVEEAGEYLDGLAERYARSVDDARSFKRWLAPGVPLLFAAPEKGIASASRFVASGATLGDVPPVAEGLISFLEKPMADSVIKFVKDLSIIGYDSVKEEGVEFKRELQDKLDQIADSIPNPSGGFGPGGENNPPPAQEVTDEERQNATVQEEEEVQETDEERADREELDAFGARDEVKRLGPVLENYLGVDIIKNIKIKPSSKARSGDKK
jgi:hypothetical protein